MQNFPPLKLTLICFVISFGGSFLYGLELCISSSLEPVLSAFINESYQTHYYEPITDSLFNTVWTVYVSALYCGALIGALIMPQLAKRLGRKATLYVTSILLVISAVVSGVSYEINSFVLLVMARYLYGISCGTVLGASSIYIGEIAPTKYRGTLGSFTSILLELGYGVSSIVGLPELLGTQYLWQFVFYIQVLPPILLLIVLPFLPESPKFLCLTGNQSLAEKSIVFFHGENADVKSEINAIFEDLRLQEKSMNIFQIWSVPAVRKSAILGCAVNFATSGSGIVAVGAFATIILQSSGLSTRAALYANVAIACSTLPTVLIASQMVERIGRRPVVLYGTISLALLDTAIMGQLLYFTYNPSAAWVAYGIVTASVLFMVAFGLGPAVVQYFLTLELVPINAKAAAQTVAMMSSFAGALYSSFLFFPLYEAAGPYSYLIFIVPLSAVCLYYYFCLPETKNRTVAEVMEAMGSKIESFRVDNKTESRIDLVETEFVTGDD